MIDLAKILSRFAITSGWVFYTAAVLVVSYLVYMMARRRHGERVKDDVREPEL